MALWYTFTKTAVDWEVGEDTDLVGVVGVAASGGGEVEFDEVDAPVFR
jgi:hypothetical protein